MIEVELQIPDDVNEKVIVRVVEEICAANDLSCTLKGTLASYQGSVHWHFKKGKQRGTLELTWCEDNNASGSRWRGIEPVHGSMIIFPY
jgi:hypothetical protein